MKQGPIRVRRRADGEWEVSGRGRVYAASSLWVAEELARELVYDTAAASPPTAHRTEPVVSGHDVIQKQKTVESTPRRAQREAVVPVPRDIVPGEVRVKLDRALRWAAEDLNLRGLQLEFYRGHPTCMGFVDRSSWHQIQVSVDQSLHQALETVLHEVRHSKQYAWQWPNAVLADVDPSERDADEYAAKKLPQLLEYLRDHRYR